jgi:hypothetical protein
LKKIREQGEFPAQSGKPKKSGPCALRGQKVFTIVKILGLFKSTSGWTPVNQAGV